MWKRFVTEHGSDVCVNMDAIEYFRPYQDDKTLLVFRSAKHRTTPERVKEVEADELVVRESYEDMIQIVQPEKRDRANE
jgi:alkylhydroperoxidase family enzyme